MNIWKSAAVLGLAAGMLTTTAFAQDKTLNMVVIEGGDTTAMKAVVDSYAAAHPGIKINLQSYPFAQFFQVAELRLRSKDKGVDLVYVDAPLVASYASRGFLSDVGSVDTSTLVQTSVDAGKYGGKQYALPINNSAQVLFYNKALFKAAGITPPDGLTAGQSASQKDIDALASGKRWTWEQIADAAKKLTVKDGGRTTQYGFSVEQFGELYQLQPFGESLRARFDGLGRHRDHAENRNVLRAAPPSVREERTFERRERQLDHDRELGRERHADRAVDEVAHRADDLGRERAAVGPGRVHLRDRSPEVHDRELDEDQAQRPCRDARGGRRIARPLPRHEARA